MILPLVNIRTVSIITPGTTYFSSIFIYSDVQDSSDQKDFSFYILKVIREKFVANIEYEDVTRKRSQ